MGAVLVTLGCKDLDVPNYTSADANLLDLNPDRSVVDLMSTGLLRGIRATTSARPSVTRYRNAIAPR